MTMGPGSAELEGIRAPADFRDNAAQFVNRMLTTEAFTLMH